MSYRIYRTEALVVRALPHRDADRLLVLYTADFGLLFARASGIRRERSRLRYALGELSLAEVALVRGKAGWRITGAIARAGAPRQKQALLSLARIGALLSRLVHGENRDPYLFSTLAAAHRALHAGSDPEAIEVVTVSRVLHALGYVAPGADDAALYADTAYAAASLQEVEQVLPRLVGRINAALAATQL